MSDKHHGRVSNLRNVSFVSHLSHEMKYSSARFRILIIAPISAVMPEPGGGAGGPLPSPQYLAEQLTLFQPEVGTLSPTYYYWPPKIFHLPASLIWKKNK